ncbi:putative tellurite resistance protein B-like protein [Mesorhizobium sp. J18]|uniref:tellurite resistance TerB family protein n=1 Tax=Mesorhizobium sp. J18 TaxID=935263 RepID=UPI00119ABAA3|nr:TerB family tellurite resistance protein [Mesorhizobium sp. J18]TWG97995.1 putative tellurite resistance protein B-like protein [Mesorhizobium sp. J18]
MFDRLLSFLKNLPGNGANRRLSADDDPRVAAVALLFHVMDADGIRNEEERKRLKTALTNAYGLKGGELDALMRAGEMADREAVDLYAFTSVIKRHLDEDARAEFIRIMWEVVLADGDLHELEDNLVWRVAELIGIDSRERIALRQQVQKKASEQS